MTETPTRGAFLRDVLAGLSVPEGEQKTLPCRWLYDEQGSALFEAITQLPEYYLTRTETQILTDIASTLAKHMGEGVVLIEYGAGASVKTRLLLDAAHTLRAYVPIDVSEAFLLQTAERLRSDYPDLRVSPVVGDFLSDISLPDVEDGARRCGFFPGSTIGNLSDEEIARFLTSAAGLVGRDGLFILGYDRVKPLSQLLPAYDDAAGVTAEFNLNLLAHANREIGSDFDLSAFRHEARWNEVDSRVEMHLVSTRAQTVTIGSTRIRFSPDETIHTENSRKFSDRRMAELCQAAGFRVVERFSDTDNLFSVVLLAPE